MNRFRSVLSALSLVTVLGAAAYACSGGGYEPITNTRGTGGMPNPNSELETASQVGMGDSIERYHTASDIRRNDVPYVLITNGWGPGFESQTISWQGTSFTVESFAGSPGTNGEPAGYPTVFCGQYSVSTVPQCGLPAAIETVGAIRTGWRWSPNGNTGGYNAAYDIWLGDGTRLQSYLMVWLRDPSGYQPAGSLAATVTVANTPGTWDLVVGRVNGLPIVNYVQPEGGDFYELEFDVADFVEDARTRGLELPGTHVNAVAVGFEIWAGPITNLRSLDFYVAVS